MDYKVGMKLYKVAIAKGGDRDDPLYYVEQTTVMKVTRKMLRIDSAIHAWGWRHHLRQDEVLHTTPEDAITHYRKQLEGCVESMRGHLKTAQFDLAKFNERVAQGQVKPPY